MLNKIQKEFYFVHRKEMNTLYFGLFNTCKMRFTIPLPCLKFDNFSYFLEFNIILYS